MYVASNWAGYATSRRSTSEMALYFLGLRRRSHFPAERLNQNSTQQHLECGKACPFDHFVSNQDFQTVSHSNRYSRPQFCIISVLTRVLRPETAHFRSYHAFLQTRAENLVETVTSQSHRILHVDLLMVLDCNFVD